MRGACLISAQTERRLATLLLATLALGLAVCLQPELVPTARQRLERRVLTELAERRPQALELAQDYRRLDPDGEFGIALAAEAAAARSEHQLAIELYQQLPRDGGRWELLRELGVARRLYVQARIGAAEGPLRRVLELDPGHLEANERLGHILQVEGRTWESAPYFFRQILEGKCRGDELLGMATTERFFREDEGLETIAGQQPTPEVMFQLTRARRLLYENETAKAERLLRSLLSARPELGEAQGRLGRIIFDRGDPAEFLQWRGSLPDEARDHPEVWFAQGLAARRLGQMPGAARCFLETLLRSPNHVGANLQIAGCLDQLGRRAEAQEFAQRAQTLSEFESLLNLLRANVDAQLMEQAATLLGKMGRYWEAAGWRHLQLHLEVPHAPPRAELRRWLRLARREYAQNAASTCPTRLLNRADFPPPRWPAPAAAPDTPRAAEPQKVAWSFVDEARAAGIDFQYFEGTTEQNRLEHIINVMGGGLGALDYDLDGWPDLYFAQAHNWRDPAPQPDYFDRLYRNEFGERFADVTQAARVGDLSFSHGVTVGDFDQDGFPDVYVGNKGPNRLYRNHGDGTFDDVTDRAGVAGNEWTTSSVFADFSGDGLPDLYVANYTLLEETARKECRRPTGERMACTPDVLTAEYDRFYLNRGDGSFADVTEAAGMRVPEGKGLGVVAWDFAGDGKLGLFVANDTTPNYFFVNEGADAAGLPHFREEGLVRGVALNADGNAQASMGVAAGDANGDGRIDLFITTFFADSKTLYSQRADGFFDEVTRAQKLRDPAFWMLGFGCQFADFDLDGWEDLIATNGHVDQRSSRGDPDRMPPQLFHNQRGQWFAEVPPARLGPFFQGAYLGRGLATLDWNRDGRTDVAISHLHAPAALVTNRTRGVDAPLVIRLVGVTGCREPTGATVRVTSPTRELVRLQTAGDGFLATNERRLQFAVREAFVDVEVRWPGGRVETWSRVPSGSEILFVEGRHEPIQLRNLVQ